MRPDYKFANIDRIVLAGNTEIWYTNLVVECDEAPKAVIIWI